MKKIVGIIICALMAFCFVGCVEEVKEDPPMELMGKTITDEYEFAIIGNEDTEPITAKDVQGVYIIYKKGQNRYLEIRFTEDGVDKFEDAIDDNENGLSITLDGEVLVSGLIANEEEPERAKLIGDYETIMKYFNKIT